MTSAFPRAEMSKDAIEFVNFDGWDVARSRGAFYLKHPVGINFSPGIHLAKSYYLPRVGDSDDEYRGFREAELEQSKLGYSDPKNDQVEFLQIEALMWNKYFPEKVAQLLWQMNDLARTILFDLLRRVGVSQGDLPLIAGGLQDNNAFQYCIFNHYRSQKHQSLGFTAHKDSGFITVLYTAEAGLECFENERWVPLDPLDGHLTIVLGHSLEVLTANIRDPVSANYHRVRTTDNAARRQAERFSFGVYVGPRMDQDLYQYDDDRALRSFQPFIDFQKAKAAEMNYEFHPRIIGGKEQ